MRSQKGREVLLKISDGGAPEKFITIGAARVTAMALDNELVEATLLTSSGAQVLQADAGIQSLEVSLEGLFKNSAGEETLRLAAFNRLARNYQLCFPNGDIYTAFFVVGNYQRRGSFDDMEGFSVTLHRTGSGTF